MSLIQTIIKLKVDAKKSAWKLCHCPSHSCDLRTKGDVTKKRWVDGKAFALIRLLCMSGAQILALRAGISSDFPVLACIREASDMEERLKLAYMDVKLGLHIKEAALKHNVACNTLQNRTQNPLPNSPGHPTLFMPHEENLFATLALGYEMFGVPLHRIHCKWQK